MRIWLGVMGLGAGIAKSWGSESAGFMHHHGAGVAGFATHATRAYSWWGHFLHSFVVPNAGWISVLVAVREMALGAALAVGLLTPLACLASLALLFTYVMSRTESVYALHSLFAVVLVATRRNSGWVGMVGLISCLATSTRAEGQPCVQRGR